MQITMTRMRAQYEINARQLQQMADAARAVAPRKYRGKNVAHWEADAARYAFICALADDELSQWVHNAATSEGRAKNAERWAAHAVK